MSNKVDFAELIKMMKNKEFKNGDTIKDTISYEYYYFQDNDFIDEDGNKLIDCYHLDTLVDREFVVLLERIDIQALEELEVFEERVTTAKIIDIINDLVKAVKQLDKNKEDK